MSINGQYAIRFDEQNLNWSRDEKSNRLFLRAVETHMNHLLQARGHVFLNEIYDSIGAPRTPAGQVVGWLRGPKDDPHRIIFMIFESGTGLRIDFEPDGIMYEEI